VPLPWWWENRGSAVTDDRNARDVTVQAGAGATEGERDLELRLAALQDPAITMQPVPLLRSQPGLLEKAEVRPHAPEGFRSIAF
jgi:hypothetical protein